MATKRENLEAIVGILNDVDGAEDLVTFATREIELIDKRAEAPRKETAKDIENAALKAEMLVMVAETPMNATDIATAVDKSVQKVSQLMRQLVKDELVVRIEGKGKEKTTFVAV
jgi:predicted transcriptional regulator